MPREIFCDNCDSFKIVQRTNVSDPTFYKEPEYLYDEYACPDCNNILLVKRTLRKGQKAPYRGFTEITH